jgi:hypothetical protein
MESRFALHLNFEHRDRQLEPWQVHFEAAISEVNPYLRIVRIAKAQEGMLQRAREMEEGGASDYACQILEEAARCLGKLKRATQVNQ